MGIRRLADDRVAAVCGLLCPGLFHAPHHLLATLEKPPLSLRREGVEWGAKKSPSPVWGKGLGDELPYPSELSYCSLICATTVGSSSVVVSPSTRPSAMSRNKRRMILALRVLGNSVV